MNEELVVGAIAVSVPLRLPVPFSRRHTSIGDRRTLSSARVGEIGLWGSIFEFHISTLKYHVLVQLIVQDQKTVFLNIGTLKLLY